ncbi:hypothetical protein DFJ58DRAFT_843131 [Suillus subalutaceus]|uniref:uncharacterized protein n=1 Tax=Suillus subalutaceus TaxID=48586 RepID=UPI001B870E97|nr:uncharacterized protein DFJ58DRAFT_843131 [Suillus subalutaceus]KAG1847687.1 hypothetical protein DFJ58DRAFT_843131 [Suillus subalutaceus]
MAAEGQNKRKATDNASNTIIAPKHNKITSSVNLEQATKIRTEEEEASLTDAIVISDDDAEKAKESSVEDVAESLEAELEKLMKDWVSPIYAFFHPTPAIEYHEQRRCHVFKCAAHSCNHKVWRYLDKKDAKSTSNMRKHVKSCWGDAALQAAVDCGNMKAACDGPIKSLLEMGSIKLCLIAKARGKLLTHIGNTHEQNHGNSAEIV